MKNANKLSKISRIIQRIFLIAFLILIVLFIIFLKNFIVNQRATIAEKHISYIEKTDATIATLLNLARLENYYISREVAKLLQVGNKKELINYLVATEEKQEKLGVLLDGDIILVINQEGNIIARSERIKEERRELKHEGYIKDGWTPSLGFEQAFSHALAGYGDVRKIIYDRDFLRREGYDLWEADGMGLTIMTPIIDEEKNEQLGVLISITFVNDNVPIVLGIKAVTDVSFTAILPTGKPIGSFFSPESVRKITPHLSIVDIAEERIEKIKAGKIEKITENFILEEFTIEEVGLTRHDGTFGYYRIVYWLELDFENNFVSFRGIAMEIDIYKQQRSFVVILISIIFFFQLLFFLFFHFYIKKKIIYPIIFFIAQLKDRGKNQKIKTIKTCQEFKELEDVFNLSFDQVKEARDILEIKIIARTRQLKELSNSLEKQVQEKTKELQIKVDKLERHMTVVTERELKMIGLKKEIQVLKKEIEKYKNLSH